MKCIYKCKITAFNDSFKLACVPLNVTSAPNKGFTFYGTKERFKLFLQRVGAVDSVNHPISKNRDKTYMQMINDAISGVDPYVYIWSNKFPKESTIKESESFFESKCTAKEFIEANKAGNNAFDIKGQILSIGDNVEHYKFGNGIIKRIDLNTYSIPFIIVTLKNGQEIFRDASEWEKIK